MRPALSVRMPRMLSAALAATFLAAATLAPVPAAADPAGEAALRMLATAIDGSPDWDAAFQAVSSDQTGAAVMTGLKVTSAVAGMTVDIDTLTVTRGTAGTDGRYAAGRAVAGTIRIVAGPLAVALSN